MSKVVRFELCSDLKSKTQYRAKVFQIKSVIEGHNITLFLIRHEPSCGRPVFSQKLIDKMIEKNLMNEVVVMGYNKMGSDVLENVDCYIDSESTLTLEIVEERIMKHFMESDRLNEFKHTVLYNLRDDIPDIKGILTKNLQTGDIFIID